jgi:hypothetical protein
MDMTGKYMILDEVITYICLHNQPAMDYKQAAENLLEDVSAKEIL